MHADRLDDAGTLPGFLEKLLDRTHGDVAILLLPFEQPLRGAIFFPVLPQALQGRLGQNGVTILAALAVTYLDRHPFAVNIGQLQAGGFVYPQSRRIGDHQNGLVLEVLRHGKNGFHLREIQNHRKFSFAPGMPDLFHRPFAFQRRSVEKLEPGNIEPERPLGQVPFIDQVKQVLFEFGFPQFLWGPVKVLGQVLNLAQVILLRPRFDSAQL